MLLFIPRSLCALKRVAAKADHARFGATQGIRIALASGVYRAEATDRRRALIVEGLVPEEDPVNSKGTNHESTWQVSFCNPTATGFWRRATARKQCEWLKSIMEESICW